MKALNISEINYLVNKLNPLISDNHISNITVINSTDLLFTFSFYRKHKLLVSLNSPSPLIALVDSSITIPTIMGKANDIYRGEIKDCLLTSITLLNNDRIIELSLQNTDEFYVKHQKSLIIELIPNHPNIMILNENREIIFAYRYTDLSASRIIIKGSKYILPNSTNMKKENIRNNLEEEINQYFLNSLETRNKEKYLALGDYLKGKIKVANKKNIILNDEIIEAEHILVYQEYANMLLTYQYDKKELENYIKENNVPFDNTKTINENINNLFKKYKKAKATITNDKIQLEENAKTLESLNIDYEIFLSGEEEKIFMLKNKYPKLIKTNKTQIINKKLPYYFVINGTRFAYGRNHEQNDFLTFHIANKDHLFFHVKDYHGAHVILMKENPSNEEQELAAELALFASGKDIGEVTIAKVSTIKKGHDAGQVILSNYETVVIKKIDERIKSGYKNSSRFSF